MSDQDEMFEAAMELPAFMGCPALGPKTLPGGFDGVEPAKAKVSDESKVKLAKKLQGNGTVPSASSHPAQRPLRAASQGDMTGADTKAAKTAEYMRRKYSFCDGLFPIRRANCEKAVTEHCWIGGRRFTMELTQDIHDDGEHVCCAKIRDNGNLVAKLVVYRGKSMAEHVSHSAFKSYVKNLSGSNRLSSRGGFLKAAIKRLAAKQQAHDNKSEAAKEVK